MTSDDDVRRKLEATWRDPSERDRVGTALEGYGQEPHEREAMRVRLAVLRLCEGMSSKVAELVSAAKQDYRDVLMWAEYPSEGRALWAVRPDLTDEERRRLDAIRDEDRKQYAEWLKQ